MEDSLQNNKSIFADIKSFIDYSKYQVAVTVNSTISMLYWQIGKRINQEVLLEKRAEYGKHVVELLAQQLTSEYGKGWSSKHLRHCIRLAEIFPDEVIVSTLWRQFSWSHL